MMTKVAKYGRTHPTKFPS